MKRLRSRIQALIQEPRPGSAGPLGRVLQAIARAYGAVLTQRARWYETGRLPSKRLPCGVVSVGNLTVGGTGKTPMTLWLAREFAGAGRRTAIVSRGYRGRAEAGGGVVSDGTSLLLGAEAAGDEPFMMAEHLLAAGLDVPVVVGRDRVAAGMLAVSRFAPGVILLDDAFQHLRLRRDLNLLLLDGTAPFGNGRVLPRGPLREPLSALRRADAVILTRCPPETAVPRSALAKLPPGMPRFRSRHRPLVRRRIEAPASGANPHGHGKALFAFSGIADNADFIRSVEALGFSVSGQAAFPDHHPYRPSDLSALAAAAAASGAGAIATTEKDYARLDRRFPWPLDLLVIGVEMDFGADEPVFRRFLKSRMDALARNPLTEKKKH